ncbi:MAG TPA: FAD-dependent oxidoreductase, partial [Azonexus sp.]|nr:FAD-dependent oxidoreductase [Azonexus sp.]
KSIVPSETAIIIDGEPFAAAILATAPQHAAGLWPAAAIADAYEPIATVYLQYMPDTVLPFPLLNLGGKFGQWVVDRGNGLLACVQSGHGEWEALDDAALSATLQAELALPGAVVWHKVIREKRATFACHPGLQRPGTATTSRQLFLAGDYTWSEYPATLEGAVRSGLRAARQLLASPA